MPDRRVFMGKEWPGPLLYCGRVCGVCRRPAAGPRRGLGLTAPRSRICYRFSGCRPLVLVATLIGGCRGDLYQPVDAALGMLNVHVGQIRIPPIEVQAGEHRPDGSVRRPTGQPFALIQDVTILVQVDGQPEVVIRNAASILDDVDVDLRVDRKVVGV